MFYAKAIDLTILVALVTIAAAHTSGTIGTEKAMRKLLDYCATHPNLKLRHMASGMVLKSHSDALYLSESQAISRAGGFSYMVRTN